MGLPLTMKAQRPIISPTFTLAREVKVKFRGKKDGLLIHIDAWRLKARGGDIFEEFEALGIEDDFEANNALVVAEWGEGIAEPLSESILYVDFKRNTDRENLRVVSFAPQGFKGIEGFKERAEAVFGSFID